MAKKPSAPKSALVVPVTGPVSVVTFTTKTDYTVIRDTVRGYIERVVCGGVNLWCNEEGKRENLPFNQRATEFAHQHSQIAKNDLIVGDVLLTGRENSAGYCDGLTEELVKELLTQFASKALSAHA